MAHLLRGKQAGISNDLSAGLNADLFALDDLARYGVNSQISCLAYDPVQSLLAVGTRSSQFGTGQIYVFGRGRIQCPLELPSRGASVRTLQFCAEKLICLDDKHDLSVYSLDAKRLISTHSPPGVVTALATDPMLDYALLGMQTGDILAYDLDRELLVPFRIPNLWQDNEPRARAAPIVSLQFHPRDIGTLLIGYQQGAVIYSFKLNKQVRHYLYELPRGAPGGDPDPTIRTTVRRPRLTQAVWHPTGTFVMTGHEDASIVFWDTIKDGRLLLARTRTDTRVNLPGAQLGNANFPTGPSSPIGANARIPANEPLFRLAWCAKQDPDDTGVLIAGGQPGIAPTKGLTFLDFGRTPVYNTSSWDVLTNHLENPKKQHILPTPPHTEVVDFCLIPRSSPHFAGSHDPIAIIALFSTGQLLTLSFPSGMPISPTNQLHPSLTFVHPFLKSISSASVGRERWLGMTENRQQGPPILNGGTETPRHMKRYEQRNVVLSTHSDGIIRLFDVGDGDEIENEKVLQVDVGRATGHLNGTDITGTSMSGASGELVAGTRNGELAVFRWGHNRNVGRDLPAQPNQQGTLTNVADRAEPALSDGLVPFTLLDQRDGPATAVKASDIGFIGAGFEGGSLVVIDLRGPAIIYNASVGDVSKGHKAGSMRRLSSASGGGKPEWATKIEFSIMTLEGEDYSSVLMHVGTNLGHLATFKIVPDPSGRFTVQYAGSVSLDHKLIYIAPINADSGKAALASQQAMANLRNGLRVNGALLAVTPSSVHIFRPAQSKGAHKSFDSYFCDAAGLVRYQDQGHCLLGLFGDGCARAYSLPSLREISSVKLGDKLDTRRFSDAVITGNGNVVGFTGPSELALLSVFGTGQPLVRGSDRLFNPEALIPPRPAISNVQWLTGTQYITPSDMDMLIGGPNRPPSKRMIAQAQADAAQQRAAARSNASRAAAATASGSDEGYWAYMQRQIQERTEKLGIMGDGMENLEQNSANWLEDVNSFVAKQKRNAAGSILKAKFGL